LRAGFERRHSGSVRHELICSSESYESGVRSNWPGPLSCFSIIHVVRAPLHRIASASRSPRPARNSFRFNFWRGIGVLSLGVLGATLAFAGALTNAHGTQQQAIQARTEIVRVVVSVMNPSGDFVGGLTQKDFRVLDRGADTPVLSFARDDAPAKVVVMIE